MSLSRKCKFLDEIVVKTIAIENFDKRINDWESKVNVWADEKRAVLREKFREKSFTEAEFQDCMQKLDEKIEEKKRILSLDRNVKMESLQFWFLLYYIIFISFKLYLRDLCFNHNFNDEYLI